MEDGLVLGCTMVLERELVPVLILIVMEDGLVLGLVGRRHCNRECLNPYCNGRWSRTQFQLKLRVLQCLGLNPYCNGRWSRTYSRL